MRTLTPWQRVLVARHPSRPGLEDFIQRLFPGFVEIHGDRRFADDHAIMTGFAEYHGQPVLLVGHVKGRDTKEKIFRNFGYARPEGYRKAMRAIRMAEKFDRPTIVFVDTPAAYPGIESEERGVAEAIAVNLRDMMMIETPIIVIVSGEGGSGGALGIAIGDRVLHAGVRDLQRHSAGGVRRAGVAGCVEEGRGRGSAQADGAGSGQLRHHRRHHPRTDRRRAHRSRCRGGLHRCRCSLASSPRSAPSTRIPDSRSATKSSATWGG